MTETLAAAACPDRRIAVIGMWSQEIPSGECPNCGRRGSLPVSVGWFCGPVEQEPGQTVPGWVGESIACGMPVCRVCHAGLRRDAMAAPDEDGFVADDNQFDMFDSRNQPHAR